MVEKVIDNTRASRFELPIGDEIAVAYYRLEDGRVVLTHTEVLQTLSGQGIGTRLATGVFDILRARNARVIATAERPAMLSQTVAVTTAWLDDGAACPGPQA
ncbi:N-acetyltransferase [Ensifer sp. ENS02]|uniref:GNAT family N-acetyltransferase n=1 Tax=Ensifer sp. ENS02 TaxID=2769290 RepID=UPI001786E7F7|nr:GNAT family N-acetyltransferase [Ensifer sp. ENS02]MBD9520284.1 N-acetyltransferase [Ensifer sp. ENS02]